MHLPANALASYQTVGSASVFRTRKPYREFLPTLRRISGTARAAVSRPVETYETRMKILKPATGTPEKAQVETIDYGLGLTAAGRPCCTSIPAFISSSMPRI